jgi:chemotaxis protein histidine kinase CheA
MHNGDKLFGLYRRFDTSVEGKGMGLYMVKTQVETLGGQVKVQSKLNSGTTFSIELPKNT